MARQALRHRRGPRRRLAAPARQLRQGSGRLSPTRRVDASDLTLAGGLMLGAAVLLPLVPWRPGVACPLRSLTGLPCPLCGMTTSVEAAVHLRLDEALAANPAGVVAVVAALVLLVRRPATVPVPPTLGLFALGATWLFQLHRFGWL